MREIAKRLQEEFSQFPVPGEKALGEKLRTLAEALAALTDLNKRMTLVRMLAEAIDTYRRAAGPEEQDRARTALLFVLDDVGRRVPEAGGPEPLPER